MISKPTKHATPRYTHYNKLANKFRKVISEAERSKPRGNVLSTAKYRCSKREQGGKLHTWTFLSPSAVSTVLAKKTLEASRGATKDPTPCTACAKFNRISEYLGGPQIARKGSAAVSRVESPEPTTNMLPQKPPNEALTPLGHIRRHPTARTARPVMNVTRNPNLRRIHPEMVGGHKA